MSDDNNKVYVIRRIKKVKKGGHHGGSWKIAYADFVTAMMTFFLLMWLLSLMNKYQLDGIAEYFRKPLKEAFTHQSDKQNKDKDRDKNKEKNKEKEKEKEKEKPNKVDEIQHKATMTKAQIEQLVKQLAQQMNANAQQMKANVNTETMGAQVNSASLKAVKEQLIMPPMDSNKKTYKIFSMPEHVSSLLDQIKQAKESGGKSEEELEADQMKRQLEKNLEQNPLMQQFKNQLNFVVTSDGLRIELRDLENKPMFSLGKTDFQNYAKNIISWLATQLNAYPDRHIVIIGHTDTLTYQGDDYSNWELSADRANATRRELMNSGMGKERILRIIGVGDTDLYDRKDGANPSNRRIEIIVLTDEAKKKLQGSGN